MSFENVVRLEERFRRSLPVGRQPFADVYLDVSISEIPVFEMLRQDTEVLLERRRQFVKIDKHETAPLPRADLWKLVLRRLDMREVPLAGQVDELTCKRPRPAVEGATQLLTEPGRCRWLELGSAVQTRVVKRPDCPIWPTHNQRRAITDVVHVVVAGLGHMLLATRPLPRPRPHVLVLLSGIRSRGELSEGHVLVPLEPVRLGEQHCWGRCRVTQDQVARARARAPRVACSNRYWRDRHSSSPIIAVCSRENGTCRCRISCSSTMLPSGSRP